MSSIAQHGLNLQDERKNDMELVTKEYLEREYRLARQDHDLATSEEAKREALRTMARLYNIAASAHGFDFADSLQKAGDRAGLPAGVYRFQVERMEHGRFPGNKRLSACPMVRLTLAVEDPARGSEMRLEDTLYFNSKTEWKLSAFLTSIGQKKPGESCLPAWDQIEGSTGLLEIAGDEGAIRIRNYITKEERR